MNSLATHPLRQENLDNLVESAIKHARLHHAKYPNDMLRQCIETGVGDALQERRKADNAALWGMLFSEIAGRLLFAQPQPEENNDAETSLTQEQRITEIFVARVPDDMAQVGRVAELFKQRTNGQEQ